MNHLDEWIARAAAVSGIAIAVSKEVRAWYIAKKEPKEKAKIAPKYPTRKR
ncbi:hypothetical protein [Streptococcus equinus]|uniref:hypothetical protein n=1 Tax=Streptococcus equinus TaxID=1335 RepID=UPI0008802CEE|nr:hypothetical protein [Streptococcus equinus]SDQ65856.1 hypothetical protein SAMN04488495_1763 [Streptococcus equinus]SEN66974.1 hypothetical protein SAMN04488496_0851 [Streptococcus equinus]